MAVALFFIAGLAAGSFLNVVLSRLPRGEPLTGRSHCLHCSTPLRWHELIPLVSFATARGRCRTCGERISWRYPLIELVTALGFAGVAVFFSGALFLAGWAAFLWAFTVLISAYDIKTLKVPDAFVATLGVWMLVGLLVFLRDTIEVRLLAGAGLALFFLALHTLSSGRWVGGADVKLGFVLGAWVGWPGALVLFLVSYTLGAAVSLALVAASRAGRKTQVPFAPFLLAGGWAAFLWAGQLTEWYLSLLV